MTRIVKTILVSLVVGLGLPAAGLEAAGRVRVVTTIPDLKSLAEAVGGDLVEVESLTRGTQNFHEAEVRPSMMLKLRRAQLLIENGADLDAWVDVAVQGANNADIVRGGRGRIEAGRGVPLRASTVRWATSTRAAIRTSPSTPAWRRRSSRTSSRD